MADADDREERHVRALADSLRKAIEHGPRDDQLNEITRAALGVEPSPGDESSAGSPREDASQDNATSQVGETTDPG